MQKELPKSWVLIKVVDISEIVRGITYQKSDASTTKFDNSCLVLRGGNIQDGKIVIEDDCVYVDDSLIKKEQKLRKGDVIIVGSTGSSKLIGKAAFSLYNEEEISFGAFLVMLRPNKKIESRYFDYFFLTDFYRTAIRELAGGININNIRREHLEGIEFPLPPLPTQHRIVSKLDTLFGHLDALKTRLDRIPQLLKAFRQSVLTQAVTGKLTEEWRGENIIANNFEVEFLSEHFYKIPNTWKVSNAENICLKITDGEHLTPPRIDKGKMLLSAKNVRDGYIDYKDYDCISDSDFIRCIKRCNPEVGDVLIVSVGATIGRTAIKRESIDFAIVRSVGLFKPNPKFILGEFLLHILRTPVVQEFISDKSQGSAQPCFYINKMKVVPIPLPPLLEQQEIVRRVESLFAKADRIEAQYQTLKAKIEQLPQALLAKAFRGELVEQLPGDGDARELLEEIKKMKLETEERKKVVGFKKLKVVEELRQVAEPEGKYGKR